MALNRIQILSKNFSRLFSGKNLTKKASLNAFASGLDYAAKLIIGFIITPMMVVSLGDYFFGIWQIMNRLFAYISTTAGSASPLEWTLANEQSLENDDLKRRYFGSAIIIWGLFLPVTGIIGGLVTWFLPFWLKTDPANFWQIRTVAAIFVITLGTTSLSFLPYAILRGQNQGYRRIGFSVLVFLLNGGLTWLALFLKTGIIGLAVSFLIQDLIVGGFYLLVCRKYIPWFGVKRPSLKLLKHFLRLSWWYLGSDVINNITFASDVVVLGLLGSVELVTSYTLTKYIPETVISIIAIIVVGIVPGLGGIIGAGDLKKAVLIRYEMFSITWLVVTVIGTTILVWNRSFLGLWVGENRFAGNISNLLIVIVVLQYVLIRTDSNIIDLTLRIKSKVIFGAISAIVSIIIAAILVKVFELGIVGVCIGLIIGRSILSIAFPKIIGRFLNISLQSQLKRILRPAIVTAALFAFAILLNKLTLSIPLFGIKGWILFIIAVFITACIILFLAFITGLSSSQQQRVLSRFHILTST